SAVQSRGISCSTAPGHPPGGRWPRSSCCRRGCASARPGSSQTHSCGSAAERRRQPEPADGKHAVPGCSLSLTQEQPRSNRPYLGRSERGLARAPAILRPNRPPRGNIPHPSPAPVTTTPTDGYGPACATPLLHPCPSTGFQMPAPIVPPRHAAPMDPALLTPSKKSSTRNRSSQPAVEYAHRTHVPEVIVVHQGTVAIRLANLFRPDLTACAKLVWLETFLQPDTMSPKDRRSPTRIQRVLGIS